MKWELNGKHNSEQKNKGMIATIPSYTFLKLFCHYNMIKKFIMATALNSTNSPLQWATVTKNLLLIFAL